MTDNVLPRFETGRNRERINAVGGGQASSRSPRPISGLSSFGDLEPNGTIMQVHY